MMFSAKELRRLILPLVVEQVLLITVGMADTVMVSSVGEAAISAISLVDSINILLINVFSALGTGGAIVTAQYLGREDGENASRAAKQLLYVVGAASGFIMAVCLVLNGPILRVLFGAAEADVMAGARWSRRGWTRRWTISSSPPCPTPSSASITAARPSSGPWAIPRSPCTAPF